eukprot:a514276_35.p1 GENE.a514276_35~~a514276_35.p1  ORF type:complete len:317 (-),score=78.92 a514276_35:380-1294(-)
MVTCNEGAQEWAQKYLQECVYDARGILSIILGLLSTCCWIPAQFPQIYENFKRGSAESLALVFLLQWVFGDALNLAGCFLTAQLTTQRVQAIYFLCVDVVLMSQFIYYKIKNRKRKDAVYSTTASLDMSVNGQPLRGNERTPLLGGSDVSSATRHAYSVFALLGLGALALVLLGDSQGAATIAPAGGSAAGRVLLSSKNAEAVLYLGTAIAWSSAAFYLGSRIPQIYKNYKRGSTEGLSLMLFVCAVLGNSFYAASIFLASTTKSQYITRLPYLLGSMGTISLDVCMFTQFKIYQGKAPKIVDP